MSPHRAATDVGGVLHGNQPRVLRMGSAAAQCRAHLVGAEQATLPRQGAQHDAGQRSRTTGLVVHRVAGLVQNDLVPGAGMGTISDLVAHGARGQKQRRFLAEQIRDHRAEFAHGRVFVELLIAHLGVGHRLAHGTRRPGLGIAQQVDSRPLGHLGLSCRINARRCTMFASFAISRRQHSGLAARPGN